MACVAKEPPQLPLKEECITLGVEAVIPGTEIDYEKTKINISPIGVRDLQMDHLGTQYGMYNSLRNSHRSGLKDENYIDNESDNKHPIPRFLSFTTNEGDVRNEEDTDRKDVMKASGEREGSKNTINPGIVGCTGKNAAEFVDDCTISVVELIQDMKTIMNTPLSDMKKSPNKEMQLSQEEILRRFLCQNPENLTERLSQMYLFLKCADSFEDSEAISEILNRFPHLARTPDQNKRLPLHVVTSRALRLPQPRSKEEISELNTRRYILADAMNQHVLRLKFVLDVVLSANYNAAVAVDNNGCLPLHYLTRQFWQLEMIWTEEMRIPFSETDRQPRRSYISNYPLFDEGTKMAEKLLHAMMDFPGRGALKVGGGSGCLLPLHVAAIFGIPYKTMQQLLDSYPQGAGIPCKKTLLGVNGGLALELFESRRAPENPSVNAHLGGSGFDRTSDLIFSYYPNILPYRKEKERLLRIEARIVEDAMRKEVGSLTKVSRMLWVWLCTFHNINDDEDHYADSVLSIFRRVDVEATQRLLSLTGENNTDLIDAAAPPCKDILRTAIDVALKRELDLINIEDNPDTAVIGALCRTIFGVEESDIPTNFVILPYKVKLKEDNTVSLENPADIEVAMEFAQALAEVNCLDGVSRAIQGMPNASSPILVTSDSSTLTWSEFHSLLDAYESGLGYLYFLDERLGTPIFSQKSEFKLYPIEIEMSQSSVLHLMPLMQMGATLMRGKLGVSLLGQNIVKHTTGDSSDDWFTAARVILRLLQSYEDPEYADLQEQLKDLLIKKLRKSLKGKSTVAPPSKWDNSLRLLKRIIDANDPKRTFGGLTKTKKPGLPPFYWTLDTGKAHQKASQNETGKNHMKASQNETTKNHMKTSQNETTKNHMKASQNETTKNHMKASKNETGKNHMKASKNETGKNHHESLQIETGKIHQESSQIDTKKNHQKSLQTETGKNHHQSFKNETGKIHQEFSQKETRTDHQKSLLKENKQPSNSQSPVSAQFRSFPPREEDSPVMIKTDKDTITREERVDPETIAASQLVAATSATSATSTTVTSIKALSANVSAASQSVIALPLMSKEDVSSSLQSVALKPATKTSTDVKNVATKAVQVETPSVESKSASSSTLVQVDKPIFEVSSTKKREADVRIQALRKDALDNRLNMPIQVVTNNPTSKETKEVARIEGSQYFFVAMENKPQVTSEIPHHSSIQNDVDATTADMLKKSEEMVEPKIVESSAEYPPKEHLNLASGAIRTSVFEELLRTDLNKVDSFEAKEKCVEQLRESIQQVDREQMQLRQEIEALQSKLRSVKFRKRRNGSKKSIEPKQTVFLTKEKRHTERFRNKTWTAEEFVQMVCATDSDEESLSELKYLSLSIPPERAHSGRRRAPRHASRSARLALLKLRVEDLEADLMDLKRVRMVHL